MRFTGVCQEETKLAFADAFDGAVVRIDALAAPRHLHGAQIRSPAVEVATEPISDEIEDSLPDEIDGTAVSPHRIGRASPRVATGTFKSACMTDSQLGHGAGKATNREGAESLNLHRHGEEPESAVGNSV